MYRTKMNKTQSLWVVLNPLEKSWIKTSCNAFVHFVQFVTLLIFCSFLNWKIGFGQMVAAEVEFLTYEFMSIVHLTKPNRFDSLDFFRFGFDHCLIAFFSCMFICFQYQFIDLKMNLIYNMSHNYSWMMTMSWISIVYSFSFFQQWFPLQTTLGIDCINFNKKKLSCQCNQY